MQEIFLFQQALDAVEVLSLTLPPVSSYVALLGDS